MTTSPVSPRWPGFWPPCSSSGPRGKGRVVEVSLLRTGAYVLGWDLGLQMTLGKVARAEPRERNQAPLMNPYRAADGRWFFFTGLEAARHIGAVCRALGRPDLADDPRVADAGAIRRHRTEIIALLDEIIGELPLAEWAARFDREGVWWAPAQTPAEVVDDPQLAANDGFVEIDGGAAGGQRSVNGPVTFPGTTRWAGRVGSRPRPAHRGGPAGAARSTPATRRRKGPSAGRAPAGPARSPVSGSRWCLRR